MFIFENLGNSSYGPSEFIDILFSNFYVASKNNINNINNFLEKANEKKFKIE